MVTVIREGVIVIITVFCIGPWFMIYYLAFSPMIVALAPNLFTLLLIS